MDSCDFPAKKHVCDVGRIPNAMDHPIDQTELGLTIKIIPFLGIYHDIPFMIELDWRWFPAV